MSSLIKSLALLLAIVGLAFASYGKPRVNTPSSLSALGDLDNLRWVDILRDKCKAHTCDLDQAFELLKKLDKIYAALDDDAKTNRNEQKMAEQFAINQIDGDQFCARQNFEQLTELSGRYHRKFLKFSDPSAIDYSRSVGNYLHERAENFAFVCRSYVHKNLDKRVNDLNETYRNDMEQTLGNKLVLLKQSREYLLVPMLGRIDKISPKWMDILLEFLKEKSGNNLDAKCYITTGDEGREKFYKLFEDSVVNMCWRWRDVRPEVLTYENLDRRQAEDYTEQQASWMKYADVCSDITFHRKLLAESMYVKMGGKRSEISKAESLAVKKKALKALFKNLVHP